MYTIIPSVVNLFNTCSKRVEFWIIKTFKSGWLVNDCNNLVLIDWYLSGVLVKIKHLGLSKYSDEKGLDLLLSDKMAGKSAKKTGSCYKYQ